MRYLSFRIRNFKGIKDTVIEIGRDNSPRITTLVGLNESGKTTILEAIHSFSPDKENQAIFASQPDDDANAEKLIPKDDIADFTGEISVEAKVQVEDDDLVALRKFAEDTLNVRIDLESIPKSFKIRRYHEFKTSKYIETTTNWNIEFSVREPGRKKFQEAKRDLWDKFTDLLQERLPTIVYFPTFLFDLPEKIHLSGRESDKTNRFYQQVFQDLLDYQGRGLTIEEHIVERVRRKDLPTNPIEFIAHVLGSGSKVKPQIAQVMSLAAATLTDVIFKKWNEIFPDRIGGNKIVIDWQPEVKEDTGEKNVYVELFIEDAHRTYSISERSLGFRWFFCFLLFTQFRASRKATNGAIFLFDEPASNLHSRAQMQLLESFPRIASKGNHLIYSTHSHHMINPHWLEQTCIVENKAVNYDINEDDRQPGKPKTEIIATKYKRFVSEHPDKISYFQPILDRLDYAPSRLELNKNSILVEGKSDFFILRYVSQIVLKDDACIVPNTGAQGLGPLMALLLGWNLPFIVLLDGDDEGKKARQRYLEEFGISEKLVQLLPNVAESDSAIEMESLLSDQDRDLVKLHFEKAQVSKKDILRFFQEKLALSEMIPLSETLVESVKKVLQNLRKHLASTT
jgi:ABC-type Mn2+/Zn2+ transport system ATPase subunit